VREKTILGSIFGILIKILTAEILPDGVDFRPLKEAIPIQNGNGESVQKKGQPREGPPT